MQDAGCTAGTDGRCVQLEGDTCPHCVYDTCFVDGECAAGAACNCDPLNGDSCQPSNCRVDSDCACGYCSPSPNTNNCIPDFGNGVSGVYCHTAQDQCTNDSDCNVNDNGGVCAYQPTVGYWACAYAMCAG